MNSRCSGVSFMKALKYALDGLGYETSDVYEVLFEDAMGFDVKDRQGADYFSVSLSNGKCDFWPRQANVCDHGRDALLDKIGMATGSRRKVELLANCWLRKNSPQGSRLY